MIQYKQFTFNPIEVNTYVIWDDTKECVVVDAACYHASERKQLIEFIEQNELKVVKLLNTHLHFDHCFGATAIYSRFGIKLTAHAADLMLLDRMKEQLIQFGFKANDEEIQLDETISDGDIVRFGNSTLQAIHVPGHSPGSIVYYNAESGYLFTGDVLFQESVGRADLPGGDYFTLIEGIEEKLMVLPMETIVFPGHGPSTTLLHERNNNPYLK